jgi:putative Holliday junction resolvase
MVTLPGGVLKSRGDILGFKQRIIVQDFLLARPRHNQVKHVLDPDAETTQAWSPTALVGINRYAMGFSHGGLLVVNIIVISNVIPNAMPYVAENEFALPWSPLPTTHSACGRRSLTPALPDHCLPLVTAEARADDRTAMPLLALPALRALLTKDQRLIGIDPGSKTIGVALSDVRLMLASPFGSLKRGKLKANAAEIFVIARKENAGGLVVGLPLSMDGTAGPAAQAARDWALALSDATGLPAALFDERLSSAAANRFLIAEADVSRRKRAESVDRLAASWMLQAALDASHQ